MLTDTCTCSLSKVEILDAMSAREQNLTFSESKMWNHNFVQNAKCPKKHAKICPKLCGSPSQFFHPSIN